MYFRTPWTTQKNDTFVANDAIFYNATEKTWQCQICNKKTGKYDWRQIVNHVNNKHNGVTKKKNKNKGPRILLPGDISIKEKSISDS